MDGNSSSAAHCEKIFRAPTLKRGKLDERITDRVKLEKVLGVTVTNNAALDSNPIGGGTVAYPAGCTVVVLNTHTEKQSHVINTSRKAITSLAFSSCGRYIVTGECGHQPSVRVWDLQSEPQSGHPGLAPQTQQVAEFLSHKYGISCVSFSPGGKYIVSVGTQHDMIVNVWDWKNNIKVASNKISTKVKALDFAENGSYFVTVGNRHVKFWYLEQGKAKFKEAVPLMGRSAILGEQRNNYFCGVACGKGQLGDSTYAITRSGLLCEFNNRRLLDKWVELRTTCANCITVGQNYIFVGCVEGIIRCFEPSTFRFIATLPLCHYLGVDISKGISIAHTATAPPDAKYPDTIAIKYDEENHKLTSIYNDHSIYVWNVHNIKRVGKSCSFLYHSACIWGVEMAPAESPLPPGSFLTCSSDDTIRVWILDKLNERHAEGIYRRNVYSNELLKIVYVDREMKYLKDLDLSTTLLGNDKSEASYDGRNGVRSIRISPDGRHLASGDRAGNIRIHETNEMKTIYKIEAHDAEVLCLEYTGSDSEHKLMASASRDRLVHVFDVKGKYNLMQTLDDHSSSITAVRFMTSNRNLKMVSCGADKSVIFRSLGEAPNGAIQFGRDNIATGKTTVYDMDVDSGQKHILTACQDRSVRIYSINSGKPTKSFKGSTGDDGSLLKVVLDRSGIYLATSCTDKSLSVYDYYSGECMATMCGHSELATGLRFTNDCQRLISASGDGCIFVWRVPRDMVVTMHARLSQQAIRQGKTLDPEILSGGGADFYDTNRNNNCNDYRFSTGELPLWAKKHMAEDVSPPTSLTKGVAVPKGRWAQRAEGALNVKSFYTDSFVAFPSLQERRLDSDGSKDSSFDSGTETRQYSEGHRENVLLSSKQETEFLPCPSSYSEIECSESQRTMGNITYARGEPRKTLLTDDSALGSLRDLDIESTAHDGDIDSDQEYRHQPLYYPTQIDSASGSEFTVTNIDADELRKSQRRYKRANLPIQLMQQTSVSGSQDSEDDDDEVSTPSGENTDRNPMSMLSFSSESLDQLVSREKYLQSTFESLSGAEPDPSPGKSSISSQFLTNGNRNSTRNVAAINAVKQTKNDPEAIKKREELNKRIADTKKKLQSVGKGNALKYSQSIHDLSYIPERDKWSSPNRNKQGNAADNYINNTNENNCFCCPTNNPDRHRNNTNDFPNYITSDCSTNSVANMSASFSVPSDLQLCGCFMKELTELNDYLNYNCDQAAAACGASSKISPQSKVATNLSDHIGPRKLQLDKTLMKYKLHKSLPVSPVSEERSFLDFVQKNENPARKSFSYFLDLEKKDTVEDFKQICDDIEKFSADFNKKYDEIGGNLENKDDDGNFSSDSLEDYSFRSVTSRKLKKTVAPRRCVSNNELSMYNDLLPKSESFFLNPNVYQENILSDEDLACNRSKSYCNSLESVLSNDSDCKSAPLEVLFTPRKNNMVHSQSLPIDRKSVKTIQTQTDLNFETPQEIVAKKTNASTEFQQKLLKFETVIAQNEVPRKKPIAFFVETNRAQSKTETKDVAMYIPTLESKNKQYRSKYRQVLNNKPEMNVEIFNSKNGNSITLTNINFDRSANKNAHPQETSSLDRHLFAKSLLESEKVCHKPPKAVRRHSSKIRRTKTTYEYVRKDDIKNVNIGRKKDCFLNNQVTKENTHEFSYKEKNNEIDLEMSNRKQQSNYLSELFDSLDKPSVNTKMDHDSLEVNINSQECEQNIFDSLEVDPKNVYTPPSPTTNAWKYDKSSPVFSLEMDSIQFALENIKILNEIQRKVQKINQLVDVFKSNMYAGKVRALSTMYESLTSSQSIYNDLTKMQITPIKFRRRNLSLPNFVERRLNVERPKKKQQPEPQQQVHLSAENPDTSLRRSCSLSDLQLPVPSKSKLGQVSGKVVVKNQSARYNNRYSQAPISRSRSTGVLNQSDSDNENQEKKVQSRLMRPTISSQNKMTNKHLQNRKRQSYSTTNLNTLIQDDMSTSDDDDEKSLPSKPIVPPRTRLLGHDKTQPIIMPRRHQSIKDKAKGNRNSVNTENDRPSEHDMFMNHPSNLNSENLGTSTVQWSQQRCDEVVVQLTEAANNVIGMYKHLTGNDDLSINEQLTHVEKTNMVKKLEMSIIRTQKMLQNTTLETLKQNNGGFDCAQMDIMKKLNELVSRSVANDPNFVNLMEQYSEILLGMAQQKMQNLST